MKRIFFIWLALIITFFVNAQNTATYQYDANNRLTKVIYQNGTTVTYTYDALGNRLSKKVVASAVIQEYTITVQASPTQSGTVTGGGTYYEGATATLKATPADGYTFEKWADGSIDNPRSVTVTDNASYVANFKQEVKPTSNVGDVNGDGKVDGSDAAEIRNAFMGRVAAAAIYDVDGDGQLTIADVTMVQGIASGTFTPASTVVKKGTHASHDYVDLGLPSGTLWATCNVGANSPESRGGYYAWGETSGSLEGKDNFIDKYYKYNNSTLLDHLTKYNNDSNYGDNGYTDNLTVLEDADDVAHVKWGSGWRMPTRKEIIELENKNYTSWTWTQQGGINGYLITSIVPGYTDSSIFIPTAGFYDGKSIDDVDDYGVYWTSNLYTNYSTMGYVLYFKSTSKGTSSYERSRGFPVRPVVNKASVNQ